MVEKENGSLKLFFWYLLYLIVKKIWLTFNAAYLDYSHSKAFKNHGEAVQTFHPSYLNELILEIDRHLISFTSLIISIILLFIFMVRIKNSSLKYTVIYPCICVLTYFLCLAIFYTYFHYDAETFSLSWLINKMIINNEAMFNIIVFYFLLILDKRTNFMFITQKTFLKLTNQQKPDESKTNIKSKKNNNISVILVDKGHEKLVLKVDDIVYFKSDRNYIDIHHNKNVYVIRKTLKEIQSQLPIIFVQVHRSFIVNIKRVRGIVSTSKKHYVIKMENNEELVISPTYQSAFKNIWLNEK